MKISDPKKLSSKGIKNIIFDWGGVITNLDFEKVNNSFQKLGVNNFIQLFSKEHQNSFLADFEIAKISINEFREEIRKLSSNKLSDSQIDSAWNSMLCETPFARIEILRNLGKKYRLFLLSNTNSIHANFYNQKLLNEYQTNHSILFEKAYYSHDINIRKPDVRIFEYILKKESLRAAETLFIDDTEIHVNAAASVGINAFHLNIEKFDMANIFINW